MQAALDDFETLAGQPAAPKSSSRRVSGTAIPHWTHWFTPSRFAAILGVLITANFAAVLFGTETFFLRDFGYFSYPLAQYHRECFWRGELPLWNPLNSCGMPYLAQWNTLVLYPPALIYLLLPLPWSLNLFCLLHLFAGGMGTYFLAHRWSNNGLAACVAGSLFVFSGFTLNCVMWPNNIAALGAMPWVVLLVQRGYQEGGRQLLIGTLAGGLQMLSGAPETILLTWVIIAGLGGIDLLSREQSMVRSLLRLTGIVFLVAGVAAAQLIPFWDLMRASDRSQEIATGSWSMPGWGWANFFVPLFHSYRAPIGSYFQPGQDWIACYYTGVGGVTLAIVAVLGAGNARVWFLAALACLGLALAFGDNGPVYPALRRLAPQLGFMRFPVKFLIITNFALPLLASFAVARLVERRHRGLQSILLAVTGGVSILVFGIVWFAHGHPAHSENWHATLWSGLARVMLLGLFVGLLTLFGRLTRQNTLRATGCLALVVLFLDGVTHSPKANPSLQGGALQSGLVKFEPPTESSGNRALLIRPAHDAIYATMLSDPLKDFLLHRQALFGNCNLLDRVPTADGFYSLYVREQRQVWSQLWFKQTNYANSPLLDFLGVAHVNSDSIFEWTNRPSALPIATIGQRPLYADANTTLDALISPAFDPQSTVYLPLDAKPLVKATNTVAASIVSSRYSAHRITLAVSAPSDTLLVVAQSFYSRWRALVDGQPAPLIRANHAFQAVPVPAGSHTIILEYRDAGFWMGVVITFLSLGVIGALWKIRPQWL